MPPLIQEAASIARARSAPWSIRVEHDDRTSVAAWLSSRVLVWIAAGAAYLAGRTISPGRYDFLGLTGHLGSFGDVVAAPVARWDAIWYLHIAQDGYTHSTDAAYFPGYPLLIRAVGVVTRSDIAAAALISLVAFLAALLALHRLTALELGMPAAGRTVLLLAFFPTAVFFSAAYTEALFLAASVGAFLAARKERWAVAGILGAAAAATRSAGVLLLVPALAFYLYGPRASGAGISRDRVVESRRRMLRPRYPVRADAAWLLLIPAGLGAYVIACQLMFGDALASWHAEAFFGRGFAGPFASVWQGFSEAGHALSALLAGHPTVAGLRKIALLATALAALAITVAVFRRMPVAYGLYSLFSLFVALSAPQAGHPLSSSPRYILVVFPLFMWLGWRLTDRRLMVIATLAFALGLVYCSALFATWHFVA